MTLQKNPSLWVVSLFSIVVAACAPNTYNPNNHAHLPPSLTDNLFKTENGANLPLRRWLPEADKPKAVIIALHGFNDYSNFFDAPGRYFRAHNIACFAYDQRGFGSAPKRGKWAGTSVYTSDLNSFVALIKKQYPGLPIYLLGESMGGAVVIASMKEVDRKEIDGAILVAPALWARETMPWYQTGLLWTLAHTMPWLALTGSSVKVQASDNIEMLKALGRDPLVIKKNQGRGNQRLGGLNGRCLCLCPFTRPADVSSLW